MIPARTPPTVPSSEAFFAWPVRSTNRGIAIAAKKPMTTKTTTNSISVNPSRFISPPSVRTGIPVIHCNPLPLVLAFEDLHEVPHGHEDRRRHRQHPDPHNDQERRLEIGDELLDEV